MEIISEKIREIIVKNLESKGEPRPVKSNRASELGHPCIRYLVLKRLKWNEEERPNPKLQSRFIKGRAEEKEFVNYMVNEIGAEIIKAQNSFEDSNLNITGSIDGMIKLPFMNEFLPFEFKGLSTNLYNAINSMEDMTSHKYYFVRKYPAQIQIYLYLMAKPKGLFFLWDKDVGIGSLKVIEVELDYSFTEELLKKAEAINNHVAKNTLPDFIKDISICSQCSMRFVCLPPMERTATDIVSDEDIIQKFERMMELKPFVDEHEDIRKELKKPFEGKNLMIGNYMIQGKWVEVKGRIQEIKPYKFWKPEYIKIDDKSKS